jgi:hypothetical protein
MKKMKGMKRGRLCECALGQTRQKRERQNIKKEKVNKVKRRIKKDEILVDTFFQCKFSYVERAKVARNATL